MSQIFGSGTDKRILILCFAAAAVTVIAGILHLKMAPGALSHNLGQGILFLIGGALQVFWAVPVIKRWGKVWQIIGIIGTAVFFILWLTSMLHLLPETNEMQGGGPPGGMHQGNFTHGNMPPGAMPGGMHKQMGIGHAILAQPIEVCQLTFIGLYIVLSIVIARSKKTGDEKPEPETVK